LSYAPAVQQNLRDLIVEVAEKNEIPFQRLASSRFTGTDTDAFAYSGAGVASVLISLPLKYMHTTVETVAKSDVEHVINLILETIKVIESDQDFRYIK
jgi:putative aminopeptidase FrvX